MWLTLTDQQSTQVANKNIQRNFWKSLGSKKEKSIKDKFKALRKLKEDGLISDIDYDHKKRGLLEEGDLSEKEKNIKEILAVYLELRDEGFITDEDYDYKKKKLLKEF